jgi:hypothetical protein
MDEVTEIEFEEVGISVNNVFVGLFTGTAGLLSDGQVCVVTLEGDKDGEKSRARIELPNPYASKKTWDQSLAEQIADQVEEIYKGDIREALIEWADACTVREPDFEPAYV